MKEGIYLEIKYLFIYMTGTNGNNLKFYLIVTFNVSTLFIQDFSTF
jgi:hypothetical protein